MIDENKLIKIRYKFNTSDKKGDLVCELTEFMDSYIIADKCQNTWYKTYLYNDLDLFSSNSYQIAFRVPRCYKRWNIIKKIKSEYIYDYRSTF